MPTLTRQDLERLDDQHDRELLMKLIAILLPATAIALCILVWILETIY